MFDRQAVVKLLPMPSVIRRHRAQSILGNARTHSRQNGSTECLVKGLASDATAYAVCVFVRSPSSPSFGISLCRILGRLRAGKQSDGCALMHMLI